MLVVTAYSTQQEMPQHRDEECGPGCVCVPAWRREREFTGGPVRGAGWGLESQPRSAMAAAARRLASLRRQLAQPSAAGPGGPSEQLPPGMDEAMAAALVAQQEAQRTMQAVVKLFVRSVDTSYTSPWQKMDAATGTGSGFSIGNRLLLTNAHVVYNGVSVRVQRPGLPGQYEGRVVCIARQCDLALVQVDEDSFWEDLPTVSFSDELPELDTNVTAVGYPMCAPLLPSSSHSPTRPLAVPRAGAATISPSRAESSHAST